MWCSRKKLQALQNKEICKHRDFGAWGVGGTIVRRSFWSEPQICVWLYSFSFESYHIVFGMPNLHKICNIGKCFDFRFFDFFRIFYHVLAKNDENTINFLVFSRFWTILNKIMKKTRKKAKNRKSENFSMLQILWRLCTPNTMW